MFIHPLPAAIIWLQSEELIRNRKSGYENCYIVRDSGSGRMSEAFRGTPDIVLPKYSAVIQVNGCFWHGHSCHLFKIPETRTEFWVEKINGNRDRDTEKNKALREQGWRVLTVWECAIKGRSRLSEADISVLVSDWLRSFSDSTEIAGKSQESDHVFEKLTDHFEGAAAKYLSVVDADSSRSNQHEIGGLPAAGFKTYLGQPGKTEEFRFNCTMAYISDEEELSSVAQDTVTWYDSRRNNPNRSPEYRLYYKDNEVTGLMRGGDFMLVAKRTDGSLLIIFTPPETTAEQQIRSLFGVDRVTSRFSAADLKEQRLILPLRMLLEELGIESDVQGTDDEYLTEQLIEKFGLKFPKTSVFSTFARQTAADVSVMDDPDHALMEWMEHEERLFRLMERGIVKERLKKGFDEDVDVFISFSLSVQNRRKSRVGHAFENHLDTVFTEHQLLFEQGTAKKVTENKQKPDFLFPSFSSYHDPDFPVMNLRMLGAKSTCKDRWRQVLAEAEKIQNKHLITLQAGISLAQTSEMQAKNLQLVVPSAIQPTYAESQQNWLMSLSEFIQDVKSIQ